MEVQGHEAELQHRSLPLRKTTAKELTQSMDDDDTDLIANLDDDENNKVEIGRCRLAMKIEFNKCRP